MSERKRSVKIFSDYTENTKDFNQSIDGLNTEIIIWKNNKEIENFNFNLESIKTKISACNFRCYIVITVVYFD